MAGRMAVTPGNNKVYTYLRINLHMHEWGHIVLVFFPFFLLVQGKDFNIPILKLDWDSAQKTGKAIQLLWCNWYIWLHNYGYIWKGA